MRLFQIMLCAAFSVAVTNPVAAQPADPNAVVGRTANTLTPPAPPQTTPEELSQIVAKVQAGLMALPGVRGIFPVEGQPNALRLLAHSEMGIRLDPLITRLQAPGANQDEVYAGFFNNVRTHLSRTDPFKPEQLRVVIRTTAAIDAFEQQTALGGEANKVVRRPFSEGLEEVVVGDTPTTIALMPVGRLADLGLGATQAFDLGRANTQTELRTARFTDSDGLLEAEGDMAYETSLLALDPVVRDLERRLGGPIAVAAPTRSKIIVGRSDRPRDMARLRAIMQAEATGTLKLADAVLVRRGGIWTSQ